MSISYRDIFQAALEFQASATTSANAEATLRSAASRAYYAALHASLNALPEAFAPTETELKERDSHLLAQDAMMRWGKSLTPGRSEAQLAARDLPRLKKIRKNADYGISADFQDGEAQKAMRRARKFIANVEYAKAKQAPVVP